ncbi:MAG: CCA tRNA nucleotidyltransferase [Methanobrevibacter sp.]|jgi:tRNA nucleotidyltransferase (CCA-adding enzyme)|nr:CCA tRNA nucleotidyltransferase [Candidatus Methanovirga aequatorialis]
MNYEDILKRIKPNQNEKNRIKAIVDKIIKIIGEKAIEEGYEVEVQLTGSIAKNTWLSGSADIDIFITFPVELEVDELKERGLKLAYYCNEVLNGMATEKYASHPYLNVHIDGYSVDIVPAYKIENTSQMKSAVDRTTLHTKYIVKHLENHQKDEVLLLKKFMKEIKVYGSEFKTGGFAGYLCELLILNYGSFENTLKEASNWMEKVIIDLENHDTANLFKDNLIVVDPTDKNRNVAASLTEEKLTEFIFASKNYIKNPKEAYFSPFERKYSDQTSHFKGLEDILNQFKDRQTKVIFISFKVPEISIDNIYPQLKKTSISLKEKLEELGFTIVKYSYFSEKGMAILTLEFDTWTLGKYEKNVGPKIWYKKASEQFVSVHENVFLEDGFLIEKRERRFKTPETFIHHVFKENNIKILKIGKNLKDSIVNSYRLFGVDDIDRFFSDFDQAFTHDINFRKISDRKLEEFIPLFYFSFFESLDDYLHPSQHLKR